jgi:hypothetical protein
MARVRSDDLLALGASAWIAHAAEVGKADLDEAAFAALALATTVRR